MYGFWRAINKTKRVTKIYHQPKWLTDYLIFFFCYLRKFIRILCVLSVWRAISIQYSNSIHTISNYQRSPRLKWFIAQVYRYLCSLIRFIVLFTKSQRKKITYLASSRARCAHKRSKHQIGQSTTVTGFCSGI